MSAERIERLRAALVAALAPQQLEIEDEGHLHAGHAGARKGGHFRVRIVSAAFEGLSLVARHRKVYEAVSELMKTDVHALAIASARTPDEAVR